MLENLDANLDWFSWLESLPGEGLWRSVVPSCMPYYTRGNSRSAKVSDYSLRCCHNVEITHAACNQSVGASQHLALVEKKDFMKNIESCHRLGQILVWITLSWWGSWSTITANVVIYVVRRQPWCRLVPRVNKRTTVCRGLVELWNYHLRYEKRTGKTSRTSYTKTRGCKDKWWRYVALLLRRPDHGLYVAPVWQSHRGHCMS